MRSCILSYIMVSFPAVSFIILAILTHIFAYILLGTHNLNNACWHYKIVIFLPYTLNNDFVLKFYKILSFFHPLTASHTCFSLNRPNHMYSYVVFSSPYALDKKKISQILLLILMFLHYTLKYDFFPLHCKS